MRQSKLPMLGGMGLHQAMAMGIPSITPDYSALSEWPNGGTFYIPVLDIPNIYQSGINTDHKVFDPYWAVEALETLYQDEKVRSDLGNAGYRVATQDRFNWRNVSAQFDSLFQQLLRKED